MRTRILQNVAIFAGAWLYFAIWWSYAFPYFPVGSQDALLVSGDIPVHQPILALSLKFVKLIFGGLLADQHSLLLLHSLLGNTLAIWGIGTLVLAMTGTGVFAFVAMLLFGLSTWPSLYQFYASEAPLAAAFAIWSVCLIIKAYLQSRRQGVPLFFAGSLAAGLLLTALSGAWLISMQVVAVYMLSASWKYSRRWRAVLSFSFMPLVALAYLLIGHGASVVSHVSGLMGNVQFIEHLAIQGHVPGGFNFAFLSILNFYSPVLLYLTPLLIVPFAFFFLDLKRRRSMVERCLFLLCGLVVLHPIVIDALPIPRVARQHFLIYPLLVSTVVVLSWMFLERVQRARSVWTGALALVVVFVAVRNVNQTSKIVEAKQRGAKFARSISENSRLHIMEGDLHTQALERWSQTDLNRVPDARSFRPGEWLLVGPVGAGSGKSYHWNPAFEDFEPSMSRPAGAKEVVIPYYAHFPAFLMEDPVALSFYLSGSIPKYGEKRLNLKFWQIAKGGE